MTRLLLALIVVLVLLLMLSAALARPAAQAADRDGAEIILLTGFEPFGTVPVNASWEAARQLDGWTLAGGREVVSVELPVVWETADDLLIDAIDRYAPVLVINVGQGGGQIELEAYAHNRCGRTVDNEGALPAAPVIAEDGPPVFETSLDIPVILNALVKLDLAIPVQASESAGSYLCNFVSYHAYAYLAEHAPTTPALFVHVPPMHDRERDATTLAEIVRALEMIVITANRQAR